MITENARAGRTAPAVLAGRLAAPDDRPAEREPEAITARWRGRSIRVWFPRARPYGGRNGSASVTLTRTEATRLVDDLAALLAGGDRT